MTRERDKMLRVKRERERESNRLSLLSRGNLLRSMSTSYEVFAANERYCPSQFVPSRHRRSCGKIKYLVFERA